MKALTTLVFFIGFSLILNAQEFLWAESYDISNCNEVAAVAVDSSGNIYIVGVHNAPYPVPYTGDFYLQKTNPDGEVIWTNYFTGLLAIGDMAAINNSVIIIGQSTGTFTYQEEQYGTAGYFMFLVKVNSDGSLDWHITDETKFGTYTNIAAGKLGSFAVHVRGQSNLGDWVWIMNEAGDLLNSRAISESETTIVDIAYYDNWVYLNGGFNGPGSLIVDTIVINVQPIENTTFTLALNEDLVAKWVAEDTTINNFDGRIVANGTGIYVFEATLEPPFMVQNYIKNFSFEGELIHEIVAPVFSNAIALYPGMTVTPNMLGLFVKNDFNSTSHAVFLFDHNLNLLAEKTIEGSSSHYSGGIANFEDDLFVAQVFDGELNFNNELTLPYSGTGNLPYIAKIGDQAVTGFTKNIASNNKISIFPNPAIDHIIIHLDTDQVKSGILMVNDLSGIIHYQQRIDQNNIRIDLSNFEAGIYILVVQLENRTILSEKFILR